MFCVSFGGELGVSCRVVMGAIRVFVKANLIKWDGFDADFEGGGVFVELIVVIGWGDELGVFVDEIVL